MPDPMDPLKTIVTAIRNMKAMFERLACQLSDALDLVEKVCIALEEIQALVTGAPVPPPSPAHTPEEERLMEAEAEAGVARLDIKHHADGSSEVRINRRRPFRIAPKLTMLLAVLAAPARTADDGLLGWQSNTEVADALNQRTGGRLTPAGVPRVVFRLREAFRAADENWHIIQTNRARGVRLAVAVTGGPSGRPAPV